MVGIMDILNKHLRLVTNVFSWNPAGLREMCDVFEYLQIDPTKQKAQWDKASVELRNQGNEHFKAGRYPEARLLYTQSLAAGIGGPLGALAYSNRYFVLNKLFAVFHS
jgi:hypothetical protein